MPYIERNEDGKIFAVYARPQYEGQEKIAKDSLELEEFNNPPKGYKELRREAILADWPVHKQLEAITELQNDRPEKMNELLTKISSAKIKYPKG